MTDMLRTVIDGVDDQSLTYQPRPQIREPEDGILTTDQSTSVLMHALADSSQTTFMLSMGLEEYQELPSILHGYADHRREKSRYRLPQQSASFSSKPLSQSEPILAQQFRPLSTPTVSEEKDDLFTKPSKIFVANDLTPNKSKLSGKNVSPSSGSYVFDEELSQTLMNPPSFNAGSMATGISSRENPSVVLRRDATLSNHKNQSPSFTTNANGHHRRMSDSQDFENKDHTSSFSLSSPPGLEHQLDYYEKRFGNLFSTEEESGDIEHIEDDSDLSAIVPQASLPLNENSSITLTDTNAFKKDGILADHYIAPLDNIPPRSTAPNQFISGYPKDSNKILHATNFDLSTKRNFSLVNNNNKPRQEIQTHQPKIVSNASPAAANSSLPGKALENTHSKNSIHYIKTIHHDDEYEARKNYSPLPSADNRDNQVGLNEKDHFKDTQDASCKNFYIIQPNGDILYYHYRKIRDKISGNITGVSKEPILCTFESKSGHTVYLFPNGQKETYFAVNKNDPKVKKYLNGQFPSMEARNTAGLVHQVLYPDQTGLDRFIDGTQRITYPDGTVVYKQSPPSYSNK